MIQFVVAMVLPIMPSMRVMRILSRWKLSLPMAETGNTKQGVALPAGWEEIQDADGKTYYVDQIPGLHSCNTLDLVLQS